MLHFIFGKVASGKTTYLHNIIGQALDKNDENAVLIVPEQFTFETDRGILTTLGAEKSNRVEVYSFTRLAEALFDEYAATHKPVLTEQSRLIFMSRALKSVEEQLEVYAKHVRDKAFIGKMILAVNEFKQSANDTEQMKNIVSLLPEGLLKRKMQELILICQAYEALIGQSYTDTADVLTKLYELLTEKNYFKGKTVAIDGFSSFNAQILKVIGAIMSQCDELYITLTADSPYYSEGHNDVFAFTRRTASRLRTVADKSSVKVAKPVFINEETTGFSPYASEALCRLESGFYRPEAEVYEEKTDDINVYCACDADDECGFVARKIRQLNREGIRCRDITVIYRDEEKYENKLKAAFRKYEIPVFEDRREPIANQPLILYVQAALGICADGFSTENVLRLLKTGLSPLSVDEIAQLENYVYIWQIDGAKWTQEWKYNPKGFTQDEPDKEMLAQINLMRESVVLPLLSLREKIKHSDGENISREIYNYLIDCSADERLKTLAIELETDGEYTLALEQEQIWDMLMEILNECAVSLKGEKMTASEYLDMLSLSLSVRSLGKVPNGIDEVTVGAAPRIKTRNTDVVFVLGLNCGVFPAAAIAGGLLSDADKSVLLENGLELFDLDKYKTLEERFTAYNAVCRARKKVFLSYALRGGAGEEKYMPSEIITFIRKQFPLLHYRDSDSLTVEERIEGKQATFELLASVFSENGYYAKNLLAYFSEEPEYKGKLDSLRRVTQGLDYKFSDSKIPTELFGKNMYLSASRVEEYETCPFKYFCRYGMGAEPRRRARLDPAQSGTAVHGILEEIVRQYSDTGIENVPAEERRIAVRQHLKEYSHRVMGGLDDKDMRFNYHFNRLAKILDALLDRIAAEFKNSSFKPCEFELKIGGDVPEYTIELSDGGRISIHGYIDRVDSFIHDGKTFLRVVDYKTKEKKLLLSDVLGGLNMQMLIYLFALSRNGQAKFGENIVPAGVLYFPARYSSFSAERGDSEEDIKSRIMQDGKMSGLILNDSRVIRAMDEDGGCVFIPVKTNAKTGKMSGNLVSLRQLELINERIDKTLSDMALSLHRGYIPAFPVSGKGHENTCSYCDYSSVCCHEENGKYRHIEPERLEISLEKLEEGEA